MAVYIVGMIAGASCMIAPLVYLVAVDACMARVLTASPDALDMFLENAHTGLAAPIVIVGAVVLLASAAMAVWTGMARLRPARPKPEQEPQPADEPEGQPPLP